MICPHCSDAAGLRRAFYAAVDYWHNTKDAHTAMAKLYEAVRDHQEGLEVMKEIQELQERIKELGGKVND